MSNNTRDVPMNYRSKFILPYNSSNSINDELVNNTKDIIDFKKSEINEFDLIFNNNENFDISLNNINYEIHKIIKKT